MLNIAPHTSSSQLLHAKRMLRKLIKQSWLLILLFIAIPTVIWRFIQKEKASIKGNPMNQPQEAQLRPLPQPTPVEMELKSDKMSQHPTTITQQPSPNAQQPTPITQHPSTNTQQPTPNTQHLSPNTHHLTPNTQHLSQRHLHGMYNWHITDN